MPVPGSSPAPGPPGGAGRRHFPRITAHEDVPAWLAEHTDRNRHVLGPPEQLVTRWTGAGLELPDMSALRRFRLQRLRAELVAEDLDGILLHDPINVRYATDTTNMPIWTMHNEVRSAWIPTEGPVVVFEFSHGEFLSAHSDVVDEIRPAVSLHPFYTGDRIDEIVERWAAELVELFERDARTGRCRVAIDILSLDGVRALERRGVGLVSGMALTEQARTVKGPDEIRAMRCAIDACELAIEHMRDAFEPGVAEVELWARLQHANLVNFGEWMETRLLASGPRTNPWYQEASIKPVAAGEMMAFDTDLVGAYGMCVDMSRTWLCGADRPTAAQADLHARAVEMVATNTELFVPGATYREVTEKLSYPSPEEFNGYTVLAHGVGLCDEYPSLFTREQWDEVGFDGVIEAGNVMCIEAFVGRREGGEGVKLEQQVLVSDGGPELLTGSATGLA